MSFPSGPAALGAAWLEGVLRRDAGLPEARVRRVSHEVIGVGFGLDGTSARVTLDGDGVPATLVAKWCKPAKAAAETRFYREIGPRLPLRLARIARAISRLRESLPRFLTEWTGRLPDREVAFAAELPDRVERAYASLAEVPQTFVHADLHLDNVLFPPSGPPVILDWTDIARGPAALDFARLFVESMTPEDRRASSGDLTLRYAVALAAHGVEGYDSGALRNHMSGVATVLFGAAVRWAAGPEGLGPDVPRVPLVVESLVRRSAAAATEWAD